MMKTQKIMYVIVMLIIVSAGFACIWFTKNMRESTSNKKWITEDKAVEIAKEAIKGKLRYDESGEIIVEQEEGQYIVTFPVKVRPHVLGPDYAARVWVDSETGRVSGIGWPPN